MDFLGLGGIVSGIGDIITGGMNYKNQEEALEFNKNAFREQMDFAKYQYEDQKQQANTAVQRRVKDLEAAGFNKLMAAGGEAGAGGTVAAAGANVQAPQLELGLSEKTKAIYDTIYSMLTMNNDLATSATQRELIKAQMYDTLKSAGVKNQQIETLMYDLKKSMKMNIRTTDMLNSSFNTAVAGTQQFLNEAKDSMERAQKAREKVKNNIGTPRDPSSQNWRGEGGTYQNGKRYGY